MLKLQLLKEPGRYVKLSSFPVTLGRDESNDLVIDTPRVSDFHAEIDGSAEDLCIIDLLSASGTFVNEHRVVDRCKLSPWDVIRLGAVELEINDPQTCRPNSWVLRTESDLLSSQFYTLQNTTIVGRDPDCDLTIDSYLLSRRHAELTIEQDHLLVRDLGSRNGTFLNGDRIEEGSAVPGDELRFDEQCFIVVGPTRSTAREDVDEDRTHLRVPDSELTQLAPIQGPVVADAGEFVTDAEEASLMTPEETRLTTPEETRLMTPEETSLTTPDETSLTTPPEAQPMAPDESEAETQLMVGKSSLKPRHIQPAAYLLAESGQQQGSRFPLDRQHCKLGRGKENELVLLDSGISKYHAEILRAGEDWSIVDCNSRNGVKVNDVAVTDSELRHGDRISLGETRFLFECEDAGVDAVVVVDDDETALFQPPTTNHSKADKTIRGEKDYAWLPGVLVFVAAVVSAIAIYLWRTG
jgi:pSer/pThr/pTyr-binding forkhead associated (FHA) protein